VNQSRRKFHNVVDPVRFLWSIGNTAFYEPHHQTRPSPESPLAQVSTIRSQGIETRQKGSDRLERPSLSGLSSDAPESNLSCRRPRFHSPRRTGRISCQQGRFDVFRVWGIMVLCKPLRSRHANIEKCLLELHAAAPGSSTIPNSFGPVGIAKVRPFI